MSDPRVQSHKLSDWRRLLDDTDMSPKARRVIEAAIRQQERVWAERHADQYNARLNHRNTTRNEKVVGTYEAMTQRLKDIRADLATGRMDTKQARAEMRDMRGVDADAAQLHDTLVEEDADLERFAAMTPDDFQMSVLERFPALVATQPTLAGVAVEIDPPPPPGGGHRVPNPNPPTGSPGISPEEYAAR